MKKTMCKAIALLMTAGLVLGLAACGGGGDYDAYAAAYNRVTAEGGMDVDLSASLTMDGTTKTAEGNFKVDNSGDKTILYLTADMDGETITQFSDGEYLYTDAHGQKTKYTLGEKQSQERTKDNDQMKDSQDKPADAQEGDAPTFNTESFLQDFASFLEAGKIQEMGLLSPITKAAVTKTTKDGDVYTLEVSNAITEKYLNTLASNVMADEEETVTVKDMKNFTYKATVEGDYVTALTCGGDMTVDVPASINSTGEAGTYELSVSITATFNNPGSAVTISLPSTDGYEG